MTQQTLPQSEQERQIESSIETRTEFVKRYADQFASPAMKVRVMEAKKQIWVDQCLLAELRGEKKPPFPRELEGEKSMAERVTMLEERIDSIESSIEKTLLAIKKAGKS